MDISQQKAEKRKKWKKQKTCRQTDARVAPWDIFICGCFIYAAAAIQKKKSKKEVWTDINLYNINLFSPFWQLLKNCRAVEFILVMLNLISVKSIERDRD